MNRTRKALIIATSLGFNMILGCSEKVETASPSCADLDNIKDPVQKEKLLKACPRSGPEFKKSEKKEW